MYISKRQNFQRLYANRRRNRNIFDLNSSTERSFDSFDTTTTDGARSSESSRIEATTTSFDSTTTNGSSADSSYKRQLLKEAKDDSGYKSLECNTKPPPSPTTRIVITPSMEAGDGTEESVDPFSEMIPSHHYKSASSRRRDFQTRSVGELPILTIQTSHSSYELEPGESNATSSDSIPNQSEPGKYNGFLRVFQTGFWHSKQKQKRDYGVDEKTDALFKEFTRYDPKYDMASSRSKSSPSIKLDGSRAYKSFEDCSGSWNDGGSSFNNKHEDDGGSFRLKVRPQASIC